MSDKEKLAELAHEQWSGWIKYMFGKCIKYKAGKVQAEDGALIIPKWAVDRWLRQANTRYCALSEKEKDSDRTEADKFLAAIDTKSLQAKLDIAVEALERMKSSSYPGLAVKESVLLNRIYKTAAKALTKIKEIKWQPPKE